MLTQNYLLKENHKYLLLCLLPFIVQKEQAIVDGIALESIMRRNLVGACCYEDPETDETSSHRPVSVAKQLQVHSKETAPACSPASSTTPDKRHPTRPPYKLLG